MPHKVEDLTLRRFGRLIVIGRGTNAKRGNSRWNCICSCGTETTVIAAALRSRAISSCGCASVDTRTVHGYGRRVKSAEYRIWVGMTKRCNNPNAKKFKDYGGRGIKVCERWRDFRNFLADMGLRPSTDYSLDRYPDNNGNYEPGNVRWATRQQQGRNTRSNRIVVFQGERMSVIEAAERSGVRYFTAIRRLNDGWTVERTFSTIPPPGRMDCQMPVEYL
jgi:hypothetical protein